MQLSQGLSLSSIYQPIATELDEVKADLLKHLRDAFSLIKGIGFEKTVVGGKQIRPALTLFSGLCFGGDGATTFTDMAVACEMTHFASLIHDDVVDSAKMRRGSESVNARWHDKVAVLVGDYVISQALYLLSEYRNTDVMRTIMSAIKNMSEGELHQITVRSEGIISEADYYNVIRFKTSSLMGAVCQMPAQLLQESTFTAEAMYDFGENFGMAFQIVDDLLDFTSNEKQLGKPIFCDIRDGKATLPTICMLSRLDEDGQARIKKMLELRRVDEEDKQWLCRAIRDCAADEYCIDTARSFASKAKRSLDGIPDSEYKKSMSELCDYVVAREK